MRSRVALPAVATLFVVASLARSAHADDWPWTIGGPAWRSQTVSPPRSFRTGATRFPEDRWA
jgi:hypothetical protein